ncbi:DeoR/GlpR family DNA-binding transcription regulator [Metabacillus arenae]|uniref:DeoR/GlpR transcriptional regulator n=1 Tax=Metabacillus arenae TaxID=2771434 RepID=A0A926NLH9_9BACI|nr:DeoR/GlpR family DNA-binding transcription regulator [Metabacillus arenae]MBD1382163.1 DeoR/GlpR transcriptional regulator [Metabacillus arenae]
MSLLAEERKRVIIELIDQNGKVRVNDLAQSFAVSTETIRRYLEELESERKLKKVYGGAVKLDGEAEEPSMFEREILHIEEKRRIADRAVSFISDGDVIFIDEGSTTLQMIHNLCDLNNITIITNSFPAASKLLCYANKQQFNGEVIFIGGIVRCRHYRTSGSLAEQMAKEFFIDKAFISIDGLLPDDGLTCYDLEKSSMAKILIKNSTEAFVLTDHSKLGVKANFKMASLSTINKVLSDVPVPEDWELSSLKCEWITC